MLIADDLIQNSLTWFCLNLNITIVKTGQSEHAQSPNKEKNRKSNIQYTRMEKYKRDL